MRGPSRERSSAGAHPLRGPGTLRAALFGTRRAAFSGALRAALSALLLAGVACAVPPPYREVPDYADRLREVETITLVPPAVAVYVMSAGDVAEEVQEWSDSAAEHAEAAARKQIEETGKRFVPYAGRTGPLPDFRIERLRGNEPTQLSRAGESWLLYETARTAITRHAYSPTETFQHAIHAFDYSLGPESAALLAGTRADAFILLTAVDHVPDAGRSTLIGVGAAAALTTGSYAGPGATPARLTAALVHAKTGDILWINGVQMPLSDLRDPAANAALVDLLFEGMNR